MFQIILEVLWLLLPAGIANMAPAIAAHYNWMPRFAGPIDAGLSIGGRRIFGAHKTIRGFIVGVIGGAIAGLLQFIVRDLPLIKSISLLSYEPVWFACVFGAALGFGALTGDAMKSFFKRRLHIAPGKSWKPFDQIDFVIGALVTAFFFTEISFAHFVVALITFGIVTFFVSVIGVALRIKQSI